MLLLEPLHAQRLSTVGHRRFLHPSTVSAFVPASISVHSVHPPVVLAMLRLRRIFSSVARIIPPFGVRCRFSYIVCISRVPCDDGHEDGHIDVAAAAAAAARDQGRHLPHISSQSVRVATLQPC